MTTQVQETPAPPKRKRGRESVRDMVLSLAVCVAVIVPIWYLGQPPDSDSQALRVVDTAGDLRSFRVAAPGVPVPGALPEGWRPTSSTLEGGQLRIGYVTPDDGYVEYAGRSAPEETFLRDQTGRGTAGTTLLAGDRRFTVYTDGDGHTSLVLRVEGGVDGEPGGIVVVGGLRETAEDDELTELAAALQQ